MPTLVDAFLVTVGIDTSSAVKAQKTTEQIYAKTKQNATDTGKAIEDSSKRAAEGISKITKEVLGLFALLVGARGIKDFVSDMITADAALGRFAQNLGQSPQVISSWEQAAQRMGGSAEATAQTFERMGQALYNLHRNGQMMPKEFSQLEAATHTNINLNGSQQDIMLGLADAAHRLAAVDPTRAHFLLTGMGIDDATANVMIKYGAGLKAYLQTLEQNAPSADTIKKMQQLQDQLASLQQAAVSLGNVVAAQLEPVLGPFLVHLAEWIQKNKEVFSAQIIKGVTDFANGVNNIANALGGWQNATELLFDLWLGSKFLAVLTNVGLLGTATASAAAPVMALMGTLAGLFGLVAGTAFLASTRPAGGKGDEFNNGSNALAWAHGFMPGYVYDPQTGSYSAPAGGATGSAPGGSISDMIRKSALAHGIDPNIALTVAAHEGLNSYTGDQGSSFGPFQLHYGGVSSRYPFAGLGDQFTKTTGLDARDKSTMQQQIDFAMNYVSNHGWGAWMGAKAAGITGMMGVGGATPSIAAAMHSAASARAAALLSSIATQHPATTSTSSSSAHIHGGVTVNTQATDAQGMANDVAPALRRALAAQFANSGPE